MKKLFLFALCIITLSCECPYREVEESNTFDSEKLLGFWQCTYPHISVNVPIDFGEGKLGNVQFKDIKFSRDGLADVWVQRVGDTDKRPITLTYGFIKKEGKWYLAFGDMYGSSFVKFQYNDYIFPELTIGGGYVLRKTRSNSGIDTFHADNLIGYWSCQGNMSIAIPYDLGHGNLRDSKFIGFEFVDSYHVYITIESSNGRNEYLFNYLYHDLSNIKFYTNDIYGVELTIDFGLDTSGYTRNSISLSSKDGNFRLIKK